MRTLRNGAVFLVAFALAACSSNGTKEAPAVLLTPLPGAQGVQTPTAATATPVPTATPVATPTPTTAPTATAQPVSLVTSVPLAPAALVNAPISMTVPAPSGYTQQIAVPLVNAAAGTQVTVTSGIAPAAGIATLGAARTPGSSRRLPAAGGSYSTIFYDSIVPSANVTVAGSISFSTAFPNSGLVAGTSYYLGFYDTTAASPSWQTIAGPVTPSGTSLTFTGTISSLTLAAGKLYGFAIFSGVTPAATPPPAPQTLLYYGNGFGLTIATESGAVVNTLAIPSRTFELDDAGNVFADDPHHGGTSPGVGGTDQLAKFPSGSASPIATFVPSTSNGQFVSVSGAGELVAVHNVAQGVLVADIWDPGTSGAPSRTVKTTQPSNVLFFALTHDGTLYLPDRSATGVPQYDVFPPGASTPATVIPETIVPASQYGNFSPNYSAVGPDGTLYVSEYSYAQPDPNAGVYIYPLSGAERFIPAATNAQGPGPQGIDVDASGNIYVVNNNTAILTSSTCQGDTLQSVTVYNPSGTLIDTIPGGNSSFPITVAADGTAFVSSFKAQLLAACPVTGANGIFSIAPGASTETQISTDGSSEIVLYDGTHKTEPFSHQASYGGVAGARGLALRRLRH